MRTGILFFFMYTSLIPSQVEHFSLRLLAMLISHLANILFIFFAYFPSSCFSLSYSWFYSTSVMWAANIFNFLFLRLSLHQSPVVTETWDHSALIFILRYLVSHLPHGLGAGLLRKCREDLWDWSHFFRSVEPTHISTFLSGPKPSAIHHPLIHLFRECE